MNDLREYHDFILYEKIKLIKKKLSLQSKAVKFT